MPPPPRHLEALVEDGHHVEVHLELPGVVEGLADLQPVRGRVGVAGPQHVLHLEHLAHLLLQGHRVHDLRAARHGLHHRRCHPKKGGGGGGRPRLDALRGQGGGGEKALPSSAVKRGTHRRPGRLPAAARAAARASTSAGTMPALEEAFILSVSQAATMPLTPPSVSASSSRNDVAA